VLQVAIPVAGLNRSMELESVVLSVLESEQMVPVQVETEVVRCCQQLFLLGKCRDL